MVFDSIKKLMDCVLECCQVYAYLVLLDDAFPTPVHSDSIQGMRVRCSVVTSPSSEGQCVCDRVTEWRGYVCCSRVHITFISDISVHDTVAVD